MLTFAFSHQKRGIWHEDRASMLNSRIRVLVLPEDLKAVEGDVDAEVMRSVMMRLEKMLFLGFIIV